MAGFSDDLRHALQANPTHIHSIRALAKELARRHGRKEATERRTLTRYGSGETIPRRERVAEIREVLRLSEEELPTPLPARQSNVDRLSQVEAELERLRQQMGRIQDVLDRLAGREGPPPPGREGR